MTSKSPSSRKNTENDQKYFFTQNIFDEGHVEESPPPSFSEQQLADAKIKSATEGRQQGLKEAENSQLKQTAMVLEKIQKQLGELSAAESLRERVFEQETLNLCLSIFEKLFPLYNETAGFAELKQTITDIMKSQEGQNHIAIVVKSDIVSEIETHLNKMKESGLDLRFSVKGDDTLPAGGCRMAWNEGGAIRDPQTLTDQIRLSIEQVLAKKGLKGHDGDVAGDQTAPKGETA